MDKKILDQYIDACELIKETEMEILRLENMQVQMAQDSVTGSNPDYPYEQRRFKIEGVIFSCGDAVRLDRQRKILEQRRQRADEIRTEVEEWMNTLPMIYLGRDSQKNGEAVNGRQRKNGIQEIF